VKIKEMVPQLDTQWADAIKTHFTSAATISPNEESQCALTYCDGENCLMQCCKVHKMHVDCIFQLLCKSNQDSCPQCRDIGMCFLGIKILKVGVWGNNSLSSSFHPFTRASILKDKLKHRYGITQLY